MTTWTETKKARRTRADDAFDAICRYAVKNQCLPTTRQIAVMIGVCQQRASHLMMVLENQGRIEWLTRHTYRVKNSIWKPPPDAKVEVVVD